MQLEATFFELAEEEKKNTLVVCDRGTMDPSACKYKYLVSTNVYSKVDSCLVWASRALHLSGVV